MQDKLRELLKSKLSTELSAQVDLPSFIRRKHDLIDKDAVSKVLDLGCGDGRAYEILRPLFPNLNYYGLDIENSPEVSRRERSDLAFYSFDGVIFPFEDEYFDAIYCRQVLEHVRKPDELVAEAARVLRKSAFFPEAGWCGNEVPNGLTRGGGFGALQRLGQRLAEYIPRHNSGQLLQWITRLAQLNIPLINVPQPSLSPHLLSPSKSPAE